MDQPVSSARPRWELCTEPRTTRPYWGLILTWTSAKSQQLPRTRTSARQHRRLLPVQSAPPPAPTAVLGLVREPDRTVAAAERDGSCPAAGGDLRGVRFGVCGKAVRLWKCRPRSSLPAGHNRQSERPAIDKPTKFIGIPIRRSVSLSPTLEVPSESPKVARLGYTRRGSLPDGQESLG